MTTTTPSPGIQLVPDHIANSPLILPGTLEYWLASQELPPPPGWQHFAAKTNGEMALIGLPGEGGLLQAVTMDRFYEYVFDGELDAREDEIAEDDPLPDLILP